MVLFYIVWSEIFYILRDVKHGPILSWTLAYASSVFWQHLLNRTLVWTDTQKGYWETLGGIGIVYFFSLIISSILNVLFVEVLSIAANFAFFVTAVFTGAVNYVIIAKCALADESMGDLEVDSDKQWDPSRDAVVDMATNMVSSITLPHIDLRGSTITLGKKIQQATRQTTKQWTNEHQV